MPFRYRLILLLLAIAAVHVAADETLYRYEADVSPCDPSTGWICGDPCEDPCSESVEDGHYVLRWTQPNDIVNYALIIAPNAGEPAPPPTLWIEWRFRSNHPIGPFHFTCDGRFAFRYDRIFDLVFMYGDTVISFSGDDVLGGYAVEEFHTFRFESTDGLNYTVAVDGQVFMDSTGLGTNPGGAFLQMGGRGACGGFLNTVNEWDFVRYGTIATGEQIIASDPPAGLVAPSDFTAPDRFTVTFDATNYVYIDDITVEVTGGIAPAVIQTRRVENTEPDLVEIVLDRLLPFGETTTFKFDTGLTVNCDPGAGEIVNCVEYTLPPPVCGDGAVNQPGEECDDGPSNSDILPDACRTDCSLPVCGDNVTDTGEACDDGPSNSDTMPDACRTDCSLPVCGDNVTDAGEACDDGGMTSACDADCTLAECGDGTLNTNASEECDDGSSNSDSQPDACRTNCTRPSCGDNVTDTGEQCDDGASNSDSQSDACRTSCVLPIYGDNVKDTSEQCDNGTSNSDSQSNACRANCSLPACGDNVRDTGEQCDAGPANSDTLPDSCRTNCRFPACGDNVKDSTEGCDGPDAAACPGECRGNCQCPVCGDGILDAGEACDNGPSNSDTTPDTCRTDCTVPTCGDNVADSGEQCDGTSDDACPSDCLADCTCEIPGIPTLSHWGLLVLAVLLVALSKRHFARSTT